jgi:hypothetical protein
MLFLFGSLDYNKNYNLMERRKSMLFLFGSLDYNKNYNLMERRKSDVVFIWVYPLEKTEVDLNVFERRK